MKLFIKYLIVILTVQSVAGSFLFAQRAFQKPNIILIIADDLGYGDVGCYGQTKIATPNIDLLAKQGMRFTQFYAGTTVCAPSRASLMTGLHTGHTDVRGNKGMKPEGQFPLPASAKTIATELQQHGYTTGAFGKWGLGFITTTGDPNNQGFDKFYGYNCQTLAHNYYPDHLWDNHQRIELAGNRKEDSVYSADLIHEKAIEFLEAKHDKPFFLYLPYTLPHADVIVPHDSVYNYYVRKFGEQPVKLKQQSNDKEQHHFDPYPHAAFAAMVARLDKQVGDVMQVLRKKGISKNTIVMFSSDNGPHKENGGDPDFFDSNGMFRGIKRDMYEGGIRVPFIACWEGKIKPGVSKQIGSFWDLYPTFQQLARVPASKQLDGISILPTLMGSKNQQQHAHFYWEFHEGGGKQAVRLGDWKGIKSNVSANPDGAFELYNLKIDPSEKSNVAFTHPNVVKEIEKIMVKEHVPNTDWPLLASELRK